MSSANTRNFERRTGTNSSGSVNARFEFSEDELKNTSSSTTTLACFEEITRNESNMYVRDSTLMSGTSLILIANTVKVEADPPVSSRDDPLTGESFPKPGIPSALLNVDDWITYSTAFDTTSEDDGRKLSMVRFIVKVHVTPHF